VLLIVHELDATSSPTAPYEVEASCSCPCSGVDAETIGDGVIVLGGLKGFLLFPARLIENPPSFFSGHRLTQDRIGIDDKVEASPIF
jgi:hypothetical protein